MYELMYFDKQAFRVQLLKINMVKILDKANNS